jgi:2-polyprenyl-3-methyl-5-hydroxy-6-metoxy-1,4-benzoquinol methylase
MPEVAARYDQIADYYLGVVGVAPGDSTARALVDIAGDVRGLRALDVACGQGRITRELARRGASLIGIDLSDVLLEMARAAENEEPLGITYVSGDATSEQALVGETFDLVVCSHGLADIDDLDGALTTVSRVLRPGGRFVFSILHPCFPGWDETAPSSWPREGGYFAEGWWLASNPGIRGRVGSSHRTLSTYLNSLVGHELAIEGLVEPVPDPGVLARQTAAQPGAGPLPMFLVVRSRRV